jgi:hypothetical protein
MGGIRPNPAGPKPGGACAPNCEGRGSPSRGEMCAGVRPRGDAHARQKARRRSVLRRARRTELVVHRYLFGQRLRGRPEGFHGYDVGGPRWGWVGEVKDGYEDRGPRLLTKALEQVRRHAAERGLSHLGIFAVWHRRRQPYVDSTVMFIGPDGTAGQLTLAEFRAYLESLGVVRED